MQLVPLVPFVFGHGPWLQAFAARVPAMADCDAVVVVDVLDDRSVPFFRLMNAANARAFGDLGMPAWVQLDCATLPTAMIGFAAKKRDTDPALVADLLQRAGLADLDDDALIPLAEYCALPTPEAGHVVGFSLFSLRPGLGTRAKALGLLAMGAQVQTGITQLRADNSGASNAALRTHCRFGPLRIEQLQVRVHSKPGTLVYRLQVPPPSTLIELCTGSLRRVPWPGPTTQKPLQALQVDDALVDVQSDQVVVVDPAVS